MIDPIHTSPTSNYEEFDNLRQSSPSPPPQYTPRSAFPMGTQTQFAIPHLNFSLSSSPLPSPIYSPALSHNLTSPYAPHSPYTHSFSPHVHPSSPYAPPPSPFSPNTHPSSPFLPSEHTSSFLPFTLSPHRDSNTSTISLKLPLRRSSTLKQKREKARRTRLLGIIACVTLLLIALAVGLAVMGVMFRWGKGGYCVRWNDGGSSGDCKGEEGS